MARQVGLTVSYQHLKSLVTPCFRLLCRFHTYCSWGKVGLRQPCLFCYPWMSDAIYTQIDRLVPFSQHRHAYLLAIPQIAGSPPMPTPTAFLSWQLQPFDPFSDPSPCPSFSFRALSLAAPATSTGASNTAYCLCGSSKVGTPPGLRSQQQGHAALCRASRGAAILTCRADHCLIPPKRWCFACYPGPIMAAITQISYS